MPRLTADDLARYRADYHECGVTVMPLVLECEALVGERDEALRRLDAETRLSAGAVTGYTRDLCLARRERDRLAAAVRDALARLEPAGETCLCRDGSQLDVAMVRAGLRHALDTLAPEGGG